MYVIMMYDDAVISRVVSLAMLCYYMQFVIERNSMLTKLYAYPSVANPLTGKKMIRRVCVVAVDRVDLRAGAMDVG